MAAPAPVNLVELDKLTDDQKKILEEFKTALKDVLHPDDDEIELLRFLLAKQWKVADAVALYHSVKKWRKEKGLDDGFLEKYPKEHAKWFDILKEYFPDTCIPGRKFPFVAKSKGGLPVHIQSLCLLDGHVLKYIPFDELSLFHVYMLEILKADLRKISVEKRVVAGTVYLQDCAQLSLTHLLGENMKWLMHITEVEANYYPYFQTKQFFVNVSTFFSYSWTFLKRFVDPGVVDIIEFIGSNDVHKLAEIIPEEFLPKSLGGTSEYDVSKHLGGGPLDQYIENLPKPKSVTVPAWKDFTQEITVEKSVGWEFTTDGYDIGFEILAADGTHLVPPARHNSHQSMASGFVSVEKPGKYTLRWDNTYSYTHGKVLKYMIFVDDKLVDV